MLALLDTDLLSLIGQLGSMVGAALIGRLVLKSRSSIWLAAWFGGFGAMCSHIAVDGQGAFVLLIYVPVIYFVATVGRTDLNLQY